MMPMALSVLLMTPRDGSHSHFQIRQLAIMGITAGRKTEKRKKPRPRFMEWISSAMARENKR